MSPFDQPKYRIDGVPASANDLINQASELDDTYGRDGIKWTSRAANILRDHGHVIDHNPDFKDEEAAS